MWITWKIFSWIIVFVMNIGKNTNMEETSELKIISSNTNTDGINECIKYEREELIGIANKCKQENRYKILNKETCVKIRNYRLNRRYKIGGKTLNIAYRKLIQQHNTLNIDNLVSISCNDLGFNSDRNSGNMLIVLVNAQSLRSKDLLLHEYIKEDNIDICIVTETWIQNREDKVWCEISALNNDNLMLHIINKHVEVGDWYLSLSQT